MSDNDYYIKKYEIIEWHKCYSDPKYFINNYVIHNTFLGQKKLPLYPFQRDVVDFYHSNNRVIGNVSRQAGTTTAALSYILWYSLFNCDKKIGLVGPNFQRSISLLQRLLDAYYSLPDFLKMGIENKRTTEFVRLSNRVTIHAVPLSSAATRGMSISLLYVDDAAFCKDDSFKNFMQSVWPSMLSPDSKIIITSSPSTIGTIFHHIWTDATDNGIGNVGSNRFKSYQVMWDRVPGRTEDFKLTMLGGLGQERWDNQYNCEFMSK